jgi:hypothetical protein
MFDSVKPVQRRRHPAQRRFTLALAIAFFSLAAFTLWLALGIGGLQTTVAVDDIGEAVAAGVAAVACMIAAVRGSNRNRLAWSLLSAAALSWTCGEIAWSISEVGFGQAVPFPSAADIGFLLSVPLGIAGLLALPLAPSRVATRARSILDGSIIALSLLFVCWAFVLGPLYASSDAHSVERLLGLVYPVGDVLTASVVVIIASRAAGPERYRFLLLLGGFLAIAVADSAFAFLTGAGIYTERGSVFDAAWVAGFALIALAALWPATYSSASDEGTVRSWQVALPGMAFAAATGSAFVFAITGRPLGTNLTALAAGVGLLLVCSHLLSLADADHLRRANSIVEARLRRLDVPPPAGAYAALARHRPGESAVPHASIYELLRRPPEDEATAEAVGTQAADPAGLTS